MSKVNAVKILSEKTHSLLRAGRYLGQITEANISRFNICPLNGDPKILFGEHTYVPAFLKIIREFIDNSIDEAIRTSFKHANKISILIKEDHVIIEDNGRGIPIIPAHDEDGNELDVLMPEAAWTLLRAGSNFDDEDDNTSIGQNGEGASLGVFFSKKFIGETSDGKKRFEITAVDNCESTEKKITNSTKQGTKITLFPDKEKLNLTGSLIQYKDLIEFELTFLSITYPNITFSIGTDKLKALKIKTFGDIRKQYLTYPEDMPELSLRTFETDNFSISIANNINDGYNFIHFVNGINVYNGGDLLDWVEKKFIDPLVTKIQKRYKSIKTTDVKSHLTFIVVVKNIPNPRFGDQIKSLCINTASQFPEIAKELNESKLDIEKFITKIYKDKTIMEPVIDMYRAAQIVAEGKKAKAAQKSKKVSPKYWPATKRKKRLFLSEGDSAINPLISEIGREENGFFPLKGKMINCLKKALKDVIKNDEVLELADILNIDLTRDDNGLNSDLEYEEIHIAGDADVDGGHIVLLVLAFFYKFAPAYLQKTKIFRFKTPILIAIKNEKPVALFFNFEEYARYSQNTPAGVTFYYAKGLGSLSELQWETLFKKHTLDELSQQLTFNGSDNFELENEEFQNWLGDDTEFRKSKVLEKIANFDIDKV